MPAIIQSELSRWLFTLYKLCAFPLRICIPGEDVHSRWGTFPFPVRMNHNGINILTGNGDVTHRECTSSLGMGMCLSGNAHSLYRVLSEQFKLILVICRNHHHWSCDFQSSGQIFLSRRFKHLQNITQKLSRTKYQSWSLCTEWGKIQKYVLFQEYFKPIVNCLCVQKETRNRKRYFTWLTPELCRTKQRKQSFEFKNLKACQLHQLGIQVFNEIANVRC